MSGNNICTSCGHRCRSMECGWCRAKKKRKEKQTIVCRVCGQEFGLARRYKSYYDKKGYYPACKSCSAKETSNRLARIRSLQTPSDILENRKKAAVSLKGRHSDIVRKQWDTIKQDPVQWAKLLEKRRSNMNRVWANMTEEEKNRRVGLFCSSHGKRRSKGNEELKSMMIEEGLYDGFQSEQVFHGYVPDEINHDLKMIVEYFGDAYHCNPKNYNNTHQFVNLIKRTVGEQWQRDRKRLGVFYRYGYSVIIVWARDFHNKSKREIERIRDEIVAKRAIVGIV